MTPDVNQDDGYPEPDRWSVAWAEGDVVKWRHGEDRHDRIFNGKTATLWTNQRRQKPFDDGVHIVEVDGDEVARLSMADFDSKSQLMTRIETILIEHAPDKDE